MCTYVFVFHVRIGVRMYIEVRKLGTNTYIGVVFILRKIQCVYR